MALQEFPASIKFPSSEESLDLIGYGITDMTIETIHVIFSRIGIYFQPGLRDHLNEQTDLLKKLQKAPVKKLIKIVLVKKQLGSQYASTIETSIRDRLAYDDKYEEDEEEALGKLSEFFQSRKLDPNSSIVYAWPADNAHVEVHVYDENSSLGGSFVVENRNVAAAILDWMLGEDSISPSTVESVLKTFAP